MSVHYGFYKTVFLQDSHDPWLIHYQLQVDQLAGMFTTISDLSTTAKHSSGAEIYPWERQITKTPLGLSSTAVSDAIVACAQVCMHACDLFLLLSFFVFTCRRNIRILCTRNFVQCFLRMSLASFSQHIELIKL